MVLNFTWPENWIHKLSISGIKVLGGLQRCLTGSSCFCEFLWSLFPYQEHLWVKIGHTEFLDITRLARAVSPPATTKYETSVLTKKAKQTSYLAFWYAQLSLGYKAIRIEWMDNKIIILEMGFKVIFCKIINPIWHRNKTNDIPEEIIWRASPILDRKSPPAERMVVTVQRRVDQLS